MERINKKDHKLTVIGFWITMISCFLPWYRWGDFPSMYSFYGIKFQIYSPYIYDNGGGLILVILLIYQLLVMNSDLRYQRSRWLSKYLSMSLFLLSISRVIIICYIWIKNYSIVGAVEPGFGLFFLLVGSSIILWSEKNKSMLTVVTDFAENCYRK